MFKPTHKIVTEANKARSNGTIHAFKRGTLVEVKDSTSRIVKVVNSGGTVQFVQHSDLEAL